MSKKRSTVITSTGTEITDDTLERLAAEWEGDIWEGHLTDISVGRPRIMGEELVNLTFRVPKSRLAIIEAMARRKGETRSEYLREAIDKALTADAS
jgi:hypothetical protein